MVNHTTHHPIVPCAHAVSHTDAPLLALLIDSKATCTLLALGERRLWTLTNCRAIPSRKIGRSVRYVPAELAAWIDAGCPTEPGAGDRIRKMMAEQAWKGARP